MELASGFVLWLLVDVLGIKTIQKESSGMRKVLLILAFIAVGFIGIVIYFMVFY